MKIGIVTLPLRLNYGGILQAYALQTALERMGHEVVVTDSPYRVSLPVWKWPYSYPKRVIRKYLLGKREWIFFEQYCNRAFPVISRYTQPFIDRYIHRLVVKDLSLLKEEDFDAFVVGSDQVWRPMYFPYPIERAYLDFARNWEVRRIAYAVSFGTDCWEYTRKQTRRCGELVKKFDAVGVREESGVRLCCEHLGVEAVHVLDPTLLLDVDDYKCLVESSGVPSGKGDLLCYILDETEEKWNLVSRLATDKGLTPFRGNSRVENLTAPLEQRIQPPVEQWLRGFMDAKWVVTDSFHACVFSILFHKPFTVLANKERGLARIESLLSMFGLEERLCEGGVVVCEGDIDWEDVDERLEEWRKRSLDLCGKLW